MAQNMDQETNNPFHYNGMDYKTDQEGPITINSKIEKTGPASITFTYREFLREQAELISKLKEFSAQSEVNKLMMKKIADEFSEVIAMVGNLKGQDRKAVLVYLQKAEENDRYAEYIPDYEKVIESNKEELRFLTETFGIDLESNEFDNVSEPAPATGSEEVTAEDHESNEKQDKEPESE